MWPGGTAAAARLLVDHWVELAAIYGDVDGLIGGTGGYEDLCANTVTVDLEAGCPFDGWGGLGALLLLAFLAFSGCCLEFFFSWDAALIAKGPKNFRCRRCGR